MEYNLTGLPSLLTPAVIIAVLAYLIRLFGKIITDSKPFSDDRNWEIELAGLFFFLNFIVAPGVVGYAIAYYLGSFGMGHWLHFIIVSFLGGWILFTSVFLIEKTSETKVPLPKYFEKSRKDPALQKLINASVGLNLMIPQWIWSIIFIYIGALEYKAGNLPWFIFISATIFLNFIFIAANGSLRTGKPPKVDVYLIDGAEPMLGLKLLKVNNDNIRLRDGNKVILVNKNQVLKIEQEIIQGTGSVSSVIETSGSVNKVIDK